MEKVGNMSITVNEALDVASEMKGFDKMLEKYPQGTVVVPVDNFGRLGFEMKYNGLLLGDTTGYMISSPVYSHETKKFDMSDEAVKSWLKSNNCFQKKLVAKNFGFDKEFIDSL